MPEAALLFWRDFPAGSGREVGANEGVGADEAIKALDLFLFKEF